VLGEADVNHTIEVEETAENAGGKGSATSAATAAIKPLPPELEAGFPPTITGEPKRGQTLTEHHGKWKNEVSSYTFKWLRCEPAGPPCSPISGATGETYVLGEADVNHTIEVEETAENASGKGSATSSPTEVVQPLVATFGKTAVGAVSASFPANHKWASRYPLSVAASVTKLSIYLTSAKASGQQLLEGVIYADASGKPGGLLGVSEQLAFKGGSAAGWYDLHLSTALKLAAGNYWIGVLTGASAKVAGFRYDRVTRSRAGNANTYTSGPANPFGSATSDAVQMSLYATYAY
jgi:hypothetical protein